MSKEQTLQALWPQALTPVPLQGLYLEEQLFPAKGNLQPFVYANYVSSVDGRIAVTDSNGALQTPAQLKSAADWILFKELQAQAECLITHSGYLRALDSGSLGDVLHIPDGPENQYLHQWRAKNGLNKQPILVIVSRTLDFPWPASVDASDRHVHILTVPTSDQRRVEKLRDRGAKVIIANADDLIHARDVLSLLRDLNVKNAYLQTGPELLRSMISDGILQRLYVTLNLSLVGGSDFLTMLSGSIPANRNCLHLKSLYLRQLTTTNNLSIDVKKGEPITGQEASELFAAFDLKMQGLATN